MGEALELQQQRQQQEAEAAAAAAAEDKSRGGEGAWRVVDPLRAKELMDKEGYSFVDVRLRLLPASAKQW